MEVIEKYEDIKPNGDSAIALGNFDGVHMGHQELIKTAVGIADERGLKSAVFTFSNHPSDVIPEMEPVKSILYNDEKLAILESLGVDTVYNVPFTRELMEMDADDFVKELLVEKMAMKSAVCGFNYRFGAYAYGTPEVLEYLGGKHGFDVTEIPPFEIDGHVVSSTFIRELIDAGLVDRCHKYMGRNYEIGGEVVVGNRLGKKLGFPTSNLLIDESMVTPPNGVYVTYCDYKGTRYPSVTNVGVKPTIDKSVTGRDGVNDKSVETHIFDFDKELYGKEIKVEFLKKLRDERKFGNVDKLSEQIVKDCEVARAYHERLREN